MKGSIHGMALFAGVGGIDLGLKCAMPGYKTVCYVEINEYCVEVLKARIREDHLDDAPIWDDIRTFDGYPWSGHVDIITGGFPCQDVSQAGRRAGIKGARSGLWAEFARIICEVRPSYVLVENTPGLLVRGMDKVLGDLATIGYDAIWESVSAASCEAPHIRDRVFILAHAQSRRFGWQGKGNQNPRMGLASGGEGQSGTNPCQTVADSGRTLRDTVWPASGEDQSVPDVYRERCGESTPICGRQAWWATEPNVDRVAHGVPHRVDRLRALGNAVVPAVVGMFWEIVTE